MRISERTLVRKLKVLGASFQQIRDLARQQLARKYLQRNLQLEEICNAPWLR